MGELIFAVVVIVGFMLYGLFGETIITGLSGSNEDED